MDLCHSGKDLIMSGQATDVVIDYETLGPPPRCKVLELSAVPFVDDPYNPPTFAQLVAGGRKYKFDIRKQKNRLSNQATIEWWRKQDPEAKKILKPLPDDLDLYQGHEQFMKDLKTDGISFWDSLIYCRGPEFDYSILIDVIRDTHGWEADLFKIMPTAFWNTRDVRTTIENRLMSRGVAKTPLPLGVLDGFIAHDSIHDCAKDALMIIYASRYALGLQDAPEGDQIDPLSIQK
ncbi:exonuclease [Pantoea phage Phynn]|nr:exonuclease [Pantoea phage Phynn]